MSGLEDRVGELESRVGRIEEQVGQVVALLDQIQTSLRGAAGVLMAVPMSGSGSEVLGVASAEETDRQRRQRSA